ncbi:MAG: hypothetical protein K8H85_15045 [Cyclobacteriaceae bacterium]|nr:hypothetical protein [Cyclobacteriaceae bacterium]
MELIYVWIQDYLVLKNIGFNFSGRYWIIEVVDFDKRIIRLQLRASDNYIKQFFPKGILSVTAIVGENGVGKSTLLDFINLMNHRPDLISTSWIAVYFNHKKGKLEVCGSLDSGEQKWAFELDSRLVTNNEDLGDFKNVREVYKTPPISSIFYNPSLDLKNYRKSLNDLDAGLVNVSTNYLLEKDWEEKNTDDSTVDQILNHRYKNTYRQFALSELKTSIRNSLHIPDKIEVRFNKNRAIEDTDLSFSAKDIFKYLSKKSREHAQIINHEIQAARKKQSFNDFKLASIKKVKHWFLVNLLENYYTELAKWFDFEKNRFNQSINQS